MEKSNLQGDGTLRSHSFTEEPNKLLHNLQINDPLNPNPANSSTSVNIFKKKKSIMEKPSERVKTNRRGIIPPVIT